mgnify:CR=1 FL=1
MRTLSSILRSSGGTSMLEILIALVIMGVVTASIFNLYLTQHKNYLIQEDVTNVQQNARASIDELGRQAEQLGALLPERAR